MKLKNTNSQRETPPEIKGRFNEEGTGLNFGGYTKQKLKDYMKKNPGMPFELKPLLPESENQRGFFEGSICSLLAYYQEGMDHHSYKDREKVREWLKLEFNAELVTLNNKIHRVGKSTKNKLNQGFLERVIGYIEDNYSPPKEALDPEVYKDWKTRIYSFGQGPDNFIDYLRSLKIL